MYTFPTDKNFVAKYQLKFKENVININLSKSFVTNLLPCNDPQQWFPDWKLETNNPEVSLELSKPDKTVPWMVACSEKKSGKAADGKNPADIQNKMRSLVSPKKHQRDDNQ